MERMARILNLISAFIMLVAGTYIQIVFMMILSPSVRIAIAVAVLAYFLLQLEQFINYEKSSRSLAKQ
ncbi:MAG: hypothetical protein U9N55_06305 [candidate division Zixibacteria bacterium]|nr:hypothetical protein [candidate division Zixibacteria bacterium]